MWLTGLRPADESRYARERIAICGTALGIARVAAHYLPTDMYPLGRFATTILGAFRGPRTSPLDPVTISLPVRRLDVEATRMNNGRYLTLMDLGRFALVVRAGYAPVLARRRWYPLVTGVMIRFRRGLRVGTTFDLTTRLVCWDERAFFLEQRFEQRGEEAAHAWVKSRFMGPGGPVSTADFVRAGGLDLASPASPEVVRLWQLADAATRVPS